MLINAKRNLLGGALVAAALLLGACTDAADAYVPLAESPAAEQTQEEVQTQEVIEPEVAEAEDVVETVKPEDDDNAEPELGSFFPGVIRVRPLTDIGHMPQSGRAQILDADPALGQGWVKFDSDQNLVFFSENPTTLGWVQAGMGGTENHTLTLIVLWGPEAADMPGAQEAWEARKSNYWVIELEDPASIHDVEVWGQRWPAGYHTTFANLSQGVIQHYDSLIYRIFNFRTGRAF